MNYKKAVFTLALLVSSSLQANEPLQLSRDIGETGNLAASHPEIVEQISKIMDQAVEPNPKYEIGSVYKGKPIWKK